MNQQLYYSWALVPGTYYSWNTCNFLSVKSTRSIFCSNIWSLWFWFLHRATETLVISWLVGVYFGLKRKLVDRFWISAGYWKSKPRLEAWTFQPQSNSLEKGEELDMALMTDHTCVQSFHKSPKSTNFKEFLGWWTHGIACSEKTFNSIPLPTFFALCISPIWLFLSYTLFITNR